MDKTQKAQVRKRLITERLALPDRLERAELLQRVMRIWLVGRPDTVIGAYWPIKGEFDPLPALYRWQEDGVLSNNVDRLDADKPYEKWGKSQENQTLAAIHFIASITGQADRKDPSKSTSPRKIGLPVVDKVHKTLTFYAWYPGCPMEPDAYDIPKPKDTEIIVPTLLFVPCLGYGLGGYRLGYGGGFYDRTLAELQPKPVTVGLGFSHGFVPDFIAEPHDVPLDAVLTDRGQAWP
jgi:5-formyltetrahydrofolate cyclo-ligase